MSRGPTSAASSRSFEGVELVPAGALVEDLRRVKDLGEIDRIRRACAIADDAFQSLFPRLTDGITEKQFALELEFAMRERGASGNSFDPIIASGPERRQAARAAVGSRHRPQRARRLRLRVHRRRLLLRHDAHGFAR